MNSIRICHGHHVHNLSLPRQCYCLGNKFLHNTRLQSRILVLIMWRSIRDCRDIPCPRLSQKARCRDLEWILGLKPMVCFVGNQKLSSAWASLQELDLPPTLKYRGQKWMIEMRQEHKELVCCGEAHTGWIHLNHGLGGRRDHHQRDQSQHELGHWIL